MLYRSAQDWKNSAHKRVALFGMSGLGKTYISEMLRETGNWFHYSVDFRIGTRYMGEHIVDNFKREAMRNPFLSALLKSDSIYIASNISFNNLAPLSTYLGKPGDPAQGGISFDEYVKRQKQHKLAEVSALNDAELFAHKAAEIYGYSHFVCDTSGSICEVVDPENAKDPVLMNLSKASLPIWIRGDNSHKSELVARFAKAPKPMYYSEDFLRQKWSQYLDERAISEQEVNPDDFIRWGYAELLEHRLPIYENIAKNWGITVDADEISGIRDAKDFENLVETAIARDA